MSSHTRTNRLFLLAALALLVPFSLTVADAMAPEEDRDGAKDSRRGGPPPRIGSHSVAEILQLLGAKLEKGVSEDQLQSYRRTFGFADANRDGKHSREEYVDKGRYMTPEARSGIFRAADSDRDGFVTREEYVFNRIVTDEAKAIVQAMDTSGDGTVERTEFLENVSIEDDDLAREVFEALDTDKDGRLPIPEYLRVWGRWARVKTGGPPESGRGDFRPEGGGFASQLLRYDTNRNGKIEPDELLGLIRQADRNNDWALDREELESIFPPIAQSPKPSTRDRGRPPQANPRRGPPGERRGPPQRGGREGRGRDRGGRQRGGPRGGAPPSVDEVFDRLDVDRDGKLTESEIPELTRQFILPADANKDGAVTKEELRKHRARGIDDRPGRDRSRENRRPRG